jgi:CHAT domain-containing protein
VELPTSDTRRDYCRYWQGSCYLHLGDTVRARELCGARYLLRPHDRRDYIKEDSIAQLAVNAMNSGNPTEALAQEEKVLQMALERFGYHSEQYTDALSDLSYCLAVVGRHFEAIDSLDSFFSHYRRLFGTDYEHLYILNLNFKANLAQATGQTALEQTIRQQVFDAVLSCDILPTDNLTAFDLFLDVFLSTEQIDRLAQLLPQSVLAARKKVRHGEMTLEQHAMRTQQYFYALNNAGYTSLALPIGQQALPLLKESLATCSDTQQQRILLDRYGTTLVSLGNIYRQQGDTLRMRETGWQMRDLKPDDKQWQVMAYSYMAYSYMPQQPDSARYHFELAEQLAKQMEHPDSITLSLVWMGKSNISMLRGEFKQAAQYMEPAIGYLLNLSRNNPTQADNVPQWLSQYSVSLCLAGRYGEARSTCQQALDIYSTRMNRIEKGYLRQRTMTELDSLVHYYSNIYENYLYEMPDSGRYTVKWMEGECLHTKLKLMESKEGKLDYDYFDVFEDYIINLTSYVRRDFVEAQQFVKAMQATYAAKATDELEEVYRQMTRSELARYLTYCYESDDPEGRKAHEAYVQLMRREYAHLDDPEQGEGYADALLRYYMYIHDSANEIRLREKFLDWDDPDALSKLELLYRNAGLADKALRLELRQAALVNLSDDDNHSWDYHQLVVNIAKHTPTEQLGEAIDSLMAPVARADRDQFLRRFFLTANSALPEARPQRADSLLQALTLRYPLLRDTTDTYTQFALLMMRASLYQGSRFGVNEHARPALTDSLLRQAEQWALRHFGLYTPHHIEALMWRCNALLRGSYDKAKLETFVSLMDSVEQGVASTMPPERCGEYVNLCEEALIPLHHNELMEPALHFAEVLAKSVSDSCRWIVPHNSFYDNMTYDDYNFFASLHLSSSTMDLYTQRGRQFIVEHGHIDAARAEQLTLQLLHAKRERIKSYMRHNTNYQSEAESLISTATRQAILHPTDSLRMAAFNAGLFAKGLQMQSDKQLRRHILQSGNATIKARYAEYELTRNLLTQAVQLHQSALIDSLTKRIDAIENELHSRSSYFGDYTRRLETSWTDVQRKLQKGDLCVEFLQYETDNDTVYLCASLLTPDMQVPALQRLCTEQQLKAMASPYTSTASSLALWQPLQPWLKDARRIFFSPIGCLNNIAIEYFPLQSDSTHTMAEHYQMVRLSSMRQLTDSTAVPRLSAGTTHVRLYGGLKYDLNTNEWSTIAQAATHRTAVDDGLTLSADLRGTTLADSLDARGSARRGLRFLPGSLVEVEQISQICHHSGIGSDLLTQGQGTEESFKQITDSITILHISTHGYYENGRDKHTNLSQIVGADNHSLQEEDRSLLRSGLFMAGANETLLGRTGVRPSGTDDGILTAAEIARQDLSNIRLTVLSACQTGLGDVSAEGVFGLQRGLKKAGVGCIIMSLWSVADEATQVWMTEFYRQLTAHPDLGLRNAFIKAQTHLRTTANGRYANPAFWAAFVMLDGMSD